MIKKIIKKLFKWQDDQILTIITLQELGPFIEEHDNSNFVLLLVAEDENDIQTYTPLIENLIEKGCIYFVCAGRKSEELHDIIDDTIVIMYLDEEDADDDEVIMTTWHSKDSIEDTAFFFKECTLFSESIKLQIAILNDQTAFHRKLKAALH